MGKARENLQVVLLQVRTHRGAEEQELLCFLERCRLRPSQLTAINLVDRPELTWEQVERADAVMIGGAGSHSAMEEHPFTARLADVVHRLIDEERPLFGSCWGHQFLAVALGGSVIADATNAEVGSLPIELTDAGRADPLFGDLPQRLSVQLGHHDRIGVLPPGFEVLARSERCPVQAVRLDDKPVYGSQFHGEMTAEHMRARLYMYKDEYLEPGEDPAAIERLLLPTPEVDGLLDRFLTLFT